MIIVGVDPGTSGAVGVIYPDKYEVMDIPAMAVGKRGGRVKNQVNAAELAMMLKTMKHWGEVYNSQISVWLEKVASMPGQGVSTMFSMGDSLGCIRGCCAALGLQINMVTPQVWKKHFGLGKDKEIVRARAIELFPEAPLSRKKDHNRAEALLIALYGAQRGRDVQSNC